MIIVRANQQVEILHEIRAGEQAFRKEIPHTPYYGTIDATMLWIITLYLHQNHHVCQSSQGLDPRRSDIA